MKLSWFVPLFFLIFCTGTFAYQEKQIQGQLTILSPDRGPPPENVAQFVVENLTLSKENVLPGENVTVQVTVKNIGTAAGQYTVVLKVDNAPVENKTVSLAAGGSAVVSFTLSILEVGVHTVSVDNLSKVLTVSGAAQFRLENMTVSKLTVRPGEQFTVEVAVLNIGTDSGSYNVVLKVDGTQVDNRLVELGVGQWTTVIFILSIQQTGIRMVSVDGLSRMVRVSEEIAEFVVENLRLSKDNVRPGETVTVSVDVANVGTAAGSRTVVLKVDGAEVDNRTVELAAGQRTTVSFQVSVQEVGTHTVSIDGLSATLIVRQPERPTIPSTSIAVAVSVIIVIIIIVLLFKRL